MQDITNQNVLPESLRKAQFSPKKGARLSLFDLVILQCQSKRINPQDVKASVQDIIATRRKTSSQPVTGPVRHGKVTLVADKSLHELEIEFTEWKTQQKHIVDRVDSLHDDMSEVKKAVFQAKWMLIGALVFAGLMNSDALINFLVSLGAK